MTEEASVTYLIEVEEEIRPLGKYTYAAKAVLPQKVDVSGFSIKPPLSEVWGESEADAKAKVRKNMEEWGKEVGVSVSGI